MQVRNLNIGTLLAIGFAAVLTLMLALVGIGTAGMRSAGDMTKQLTSEDMRQLIQTQEWVGAIEANTARTIAAAKTSDPAAEKYFLDLIAKYSKRVEELQEDAKKNMADDAAGIAMLERIAKARSEYRSARATAFKEKTAGNAESAQRFFESEMMPKVQAYLDRMHELNDYQRRKVDQRAAEIDAMHSNSIKLQLLLAGAALLMGAACAWWITRAIAQPLRYALQIARTVAAGDLGSRIEVPSTNETGQLILALKDMNDNLAAIVSQVRSGAETIATATGEIAAGNLDLSSRTEEQAGSLAHTANAMHELTGIVKQNGDNARQANQLAISASDVAVKGGAMVKQVVDTMSSIDASARKIVDIISVIDGIAFQTNILALNAAVEAARAGEQGRGFAVVASEVRNLAQRSATAAKEIKTLIGDSAEKVETGSRLVNQAGSTMDEMVASVARVTAIMHEISAASGGQESGIEQINHAIAEMDTVTQQNAALVEQAAAASASLEDQAANLARAVSVFKLDDGAVRRQSPSAPQRQSGKGARTALRLAAAYA